MSCAPCPNPPWNTAGVPVVLPEPVNADPEIVAVRISPPVSTLSTNTVASLAGVEPPRVVPDTTIASPTV